MEGVGAGLQLVPAIIKAKNQNEANKVAQAIGVHVKESEEKTKDQVNDPSPST